MNGFKVVCKTCNKTFFGLNEKQANNMLRQHELSDAHKKKLEEVRGKW